MAPLPLRQRRSFAALQAHYELIKDRHLRELFAEDPERGTRLTAQASGLYLDYSKNRITDETMRLLVALARESEVEERRDAMFRGERINVSEDRSVLHVALRMPREDSLVVDGVDVVAEVHEVRDRHGEHSPRAGSPPGGSSSPGPEGTVAAGRPARSRRRRRRPSPRSSPAPRAQPAGGVGGARAAGGR